MMPPKTSVKKEKEIEKDYSEREELLIRENQALRDLINLKDDPFFRQQILVVLERIALAEERQALALEESLGNSIKNEEEK